MKKMKSKRKSFEALEEELQLKDQPLKKKYKMHISIDGGSSNRSKQNQKKISEPLSPKSPKVKYGNEDLIHTTKKKMNRGPKNSETYRTDLHQQTKTQRYNTSYPHNLNKKTIRGNHYTDRKSRQKPISPERNLSNKLQNSKSTSPKIKLKNQSNSINTNIKSPKKLNKSKSSVFSKKKKKMKVMFQNNFFLVGDNFVQVNQNIFKKISENYQVNSTLFERNTTNQNMEQFRIFRNQRTQSTNLKATQKMNNNFENTIVNNLSISQQKSGMDESSKKQEYDHESSVVQTLKNIEIQEARGIQCLVNSKNNIEDEEHEQRKSKDGEWNEDSLQMRMNAASLQMKTRRQILDRLHLNEKIDQTTYMQNLDLIMQSYDRELSEIQDLRSLIERNAKRIQQLVSKTKSDILTADHLNDKPANQILDDMLGWERQAKKKDEIGKLEHLLVNDRLNKTITHNQVNEFYGDEPRRQASPMNTNFTELLTNYKETQTIKIQIQQRISIQMGLVMDSPTSGVKTSVPGVFLFLKNFFSFYIDKYASEFLRTINIPYGYSPEQRLMYMQGYDDDEALVERINKVEFGVEEVIRPQILDEFHRCYYQEENENTKYEKLHNRLLLDCLNEALNVYRPYFHINGPPYYWTSSERALTFYYITDENIDEVYEKTQMQVLKWASFLCGLMIPNCQDCHREEPPSNTTLTELLNQYTKCNNEILLEQRQGKFIKREKSQIEENNYEWMFFDEQKTAICYEVSSLVLEELSAEIQSLLIL